MTVEQAAAVVDAVIKYNYNVDPLQQITAVYGDGLAESYIKEKTRIAASSLTSWWGSLDNNHRYKLISAAMQRYNIEMEKL